MPLFLLDRDGVVVANRATNIKSREDLQLLPGVAAAIGRLNAAGYTVAICTNQPEVARGAMSAADLDAVHRALVEMLAHEGARIADIICCTAARKCPRLKPAGAMLREALRRYAAEPTETAFVGDQSVDLKAAFHARCRRVLVRTGLGEKTVRLGIASYLQPVEIHEDLAAAVVAELSRVRETLASAAEPAKAFQHVCSHDRRGH